MVVRTASATSSMRSRSMRKCASPSRKPAASIISARPRTACAVRSERASRSVAAARALTISILFQRAPDGVGQILRLRRLGRIIAGRLLGRDLDMRVSRMESVRDRYPLDDVDALASQRVMFHVAHRQEAIDPLQAEPVDHVGHQLLEARVLHARDALRALEIGGRRVALLLALARIVDQEFCDFAERAALFPVVDDDAEPTGLRAPRAFLDAVNEIGTAGADV